MTKPTSTPSSRIIKLVLIGSMIIMGACGLVYEYVLSVLGNYLMGTSYEEIFIIIGLMMFAMGIGSLVQRIVTGNLFERFLVLEIALGLIGGFSATIVYTMFTFTPAYRVVLYIIALLIGTMIGMEIPLLIRINQKYSESLRVNLSEILCMDYIGSLIGALFFTYVLLTHLSLAQISFVLGLTNVVIGLISLFVFRYYLDNYTKLFFFAFMALIVVCFGLFKAQDWSEWAEQKYYSDPIIFSQTTRFQHLTVTKGKNEINFFINGHLQFSSSDEFVYHELLVIPAMLLSERHEKVLILGGGDGLALREVLKFPGVRQIDLVDLDPQVIELSTQQPEIVELNKASFYDARVRICGSKAFEAGEKVSVNTKNWRQEFVLNQHKYPVAEVNLLFIDADLFVREFKGQYDRIFIDLPDPSNLELTKLYSRDFYSALMNHLDPEGFLVVQSTSPYHTKHSFLCIGQTLETAGYKILPYHENVPSFGEWGWHLCWRNHREPIEILNSLNKMTLPPIETRYLTASILPSRFIFPKYMLATKKDILPNSKMNPRLWDYYRQDMRRGI